MVKSYISKIYVKYEDFFMYKNFLIMLLLLLFSTNAWSCKWSVTVLEEENRVLSMNLGETVPANTSFKIPGIASCNVVNDGHIYTMCTYDKTDNSVVVMPFNDKILGQMSNMMIFDGNIEDESKKYIVVTMCSSEINF